ncbi:hypothetical protein C1646_670019 [Rhizophagus diaphanus]|nr:hypothetical protein C1646_670019 [Rhizophagus diaphanus] [Rhizophagus sp. MUCL 43196]
MLDEDLLKRPSSIEVLNIIEKWIIPPSEKKIGDITDLGENNGEFINVPVGYNNIATESHPQTYYKSHLLGITSKKLNEILQSEDLQASGKVIEMLKLFKH